MKICLQKSGVGTHWNCLIRQLQCTLSSCFKGKNTKNNPKDIAQMTTSAGTLNSVNFKFTDNLTLVTEVERFKINSIIITLIVPNNQVHE